MRIPFIFLILFIVSNVLRADNISQEVKINKTARTTKNMWIENAKFKEQELHRRLSKKLSSDLFYSLRDNKPSILFQELIEGKGTVFTIRDINKQLDRSDASIIQYLSIYIPFKVDNNFEKDLSIEKNFIIAFTKGSPSFRNVCYGYAKKGKIKVSGLLPGIGYKPMDESTNKSSVELITVDIDVEINTKYSNQAWAGNCGKFVLKDKFELYKTSLMDVLEK